MIYVYYKEKESNEEIIKLINQKKFDMERVFIDDQQSGDDELRTLCSSVIKSGDTLILDTFLDIENDNAKRLAVTLKRFQEIEIKLISLKEPNMSGLKVYQRFYEATILNKHFRDKRREDAYRKAVEEGRVGRKKTDESKISQAVELYDKGDLSVKQILFVSGISKSVFYRALKNTKKEEK